MSQTSNTSTVGKILNLFKTAVSGLLGLLSGAFLMYLSPVLEQVIKPTKPVPNFAYHVKGLEVTFENRSTGSEGWWDFGDGSALEAFVADQRNISHVFPEPGEYRVKLILRNVLGEESEREVSLRLTETLPGPPKIAQFAVEPLEPNRYAPATFRVKASVVNANACFWIRDDGPPVEMIKDGLEQQERYVTFAKAGKYQVRLVAIQDKKIVEQVQTVDVNPPAFGDLLAIIRMQAEGIKVSNVDRQINEKIVFENAEKLDVVPFSREIAAWQEGKIVEAITAEPVSVPYIRNAKFTIVREGAAAVLTGEFIPAKYEAQSSTTPHWVVPVVIRQESLSKKTTLNCDPIVAHLSNPGSALVPLPKVPNDWQILQQSIQLEVYENGQRIWSGVELPERAAIMSQNRPCQLTAAKQDTNLRIEVFPSQRVSLWGR